MLSTSTMNKIPIPSYFPKVVTAAKLAIVVYISPEARIENL